MIKSKDVRVGNKVLYGTEIATIIGMSRMSVNLTHGKDKGLEKTNIVNYEFIKPIKLTKEILLKSGFNTDYKDGWIGIDVKSEGGMTTDFVIATPNNMGEWQDYYAFVYDEYKFVSLEYVHELQNLFTDMTKQELDINI